MPDYWVIVRRGNPELLDLLSTAFRGRSGFTVIVDRRETASRWASLERRGQNDDWNDHNFFVAERFSLFS